MMVEERIDGEGGGKVRKRGLCIREEGGRKDGRGLWIKEGRGEKDGERNCGKRKKCITWKSF